MWCYPSRPHILQEPRNRRKTRSVEGKNRVKAANREKHHGSGKGSHCKVKGHGHWNHLCGEKAFANQMARWVVLATDWLSFHLDAFCFFQIMASIISLQGPCGQQTPCLGSEGFSLHSRLIMPVVSYETEDAFDLNYRSRSLGIR